MYWKCDICQRLEVYLSLLLSGVASHSTYSHKNFSCLCISRPLVSFHFRERRKKTRNWMFYRFPSYSFPYLQYSLIPSHSLLISFITDKLNYFLPNSFPYAKTISCWSLFWVKASWRMLFVHASHRVKCSELKVFFMWRVTLQRISLDLEY